MMAQRRTKQTAIIVRPQPSAAIQSLVTPPKVTAGDVFDRSKEVVLAHQRACGLVAAITDAMLETTYKTATATAEHIAAAVG